MKGRQPNPRGESLNARQKRVFAIVGGLLIVVVAGLSAWAALGNGSYGRSAGGCVTVVEPSSTGGAVLHACGDGARAMCRRAFTQHSRLDLLTRPQCRLAGLAPSGGEPVHESRSPESQSLDSRQGPAAKRWPHPPQGGLRHGLGARSFCVTDAIAWPTKSLPGTRGTRTPPAMLRVARKRQRANWPDARFSQH